MTQVEARAMLERAGFELSDRAPVPGTSFTGEIVVSWDGHAVGVVFLKGDEVDGRDVAQFCENARLVR